MSPLKGYKKQLSSNRGFTLVEILVAILIISLVSIVIFPNLRKQNTNQTFKSEVLGIQNNLKKAQSMSSNSTKCSTNLSSLAWSVILTSTAPISYNLKGYCIDSNLTSSTISVPVVATTSVAIVSSTCGAGTIPVELRFDKTGFSYACNGSASFTSAIFTVQLQNTKNTTQTFTLLINTIGIISQT